jgi:hypothetical protein
MVSYYGSPVVIHRQIKAVLYMIAQIERNQLKVNGEYIYISSPVNLRTPSTRDY